MTEAGPDPLRIVAVHGVNNHFGSEISDTRIEELRRLKAAAWTRQLSQGLGHTVHRLDLDFAYYADKLATGPTAHGADGPDYLDSPLAQQMLTDWAYELGVSDQVVQGHATVPLRALSSWVARKFDLAEGPLRVFLRLLFTEVSVYLEAEAAPARHAAREEVAARIARHQPRIVIAHSLGSVVAYEALHAHPELRPELFLTLGSPLALPRAVFHRLVPTPLSDGQTLRGTRPPGVTRWVNITDVGDPVAVPPQLSSFFEGIAMDHPTVISGLFRFHHAENYLRSATTAATLAPYLGL